jgi:hypothetical protein
MEDSVLSFLKAEWKVSDTGSAHWANKKLSKKLVIFFLITLIQDLYNFILQLYEVFFFVFSSQI